MRRYPDLDLLRGLAVLLMMAYHTAYDLSQVWGWNIPVFDGGWWLLARGTANLFLFVSGVTAAVVWKRTEGIGFAKSYTRRFFHLALFALLVTLSTFAVDHETYVRFGILHLMAASALLLPLFAPLKEGNLIIGTVLVILGPIVRSFIAPTSLLLPVGVLPRNFETVDYFPLVPWFGVILIGFAIGHAVYVRRKKTFLPIERAPNWVTWPGQHALGLYLWHQPIILAILSVLLGWPR